MEPIHVEVYCPVMNSLAPTVKLPNQKIGFWIHPTNIFVDIEDGVGFCIDKDIAKTLLQKIAESEEKSVCIISDETLKQSLLRVLESVPLPITKKKSKQADQ